MLGKVEVWGIYIRFSQFVRGGGVNWSNAFRPADAVPPPRSRGQDFSACVIEYRFLILSHAYYLRVSFRVYEDELHC
jgi:hypothetical protein